VKLEDAALLRGAPLAAEVVEAREHRLALAPLVVGVER
jgi:hypothetical protein